MGLDDADAKGPFKTASNEAEGSTDQDSSKVPEMIKESQPVLRPRPPAIGQSVDEKAFNERWRAEQRRAQPTQLDPFEQIDRQAGLRNDFNIQVDIIGQADARLNQADDRLAEALEVRDQQIAAGQEPSAELIEKIDLLWQDALRSAEHLQQLEDSAQPVNKKEHDDPFSQIDKRSNDRNQDRGR